MSGIQVFDKECLVAETQVVIIRVVKFPGGSVLVFIGDEETGLLKDLSLSIGLTATTVINLHGLTDETSSTMSVSLAKKLSSKYNENKPVYISFNMRPEDATLNHHQVNQCIRDAMKEAYRAR